jgi:cellulose biosynthesis protein BcsQ
MKVLTVTNHKGGCAKTTIALNVAVTFAATGAKVLAIDLDPQGNLSAPRLTAKKEDRTKHLNVGKESETDIQEEVTWTPQMPLTEEQRQNTLNALREAKTADSVLFREFKAYGEIEYTTEDFNWLMENLEK